MCRRFIKMIATTILPLACFRVFSGLLVYWRIFCGNLLIFFALSFLHANSLYAEAPKTLNEDPEFVEARELFWSGQYDASEKKFNLYLKMRPDDEASKNFLLMIAQSRRYDPSKIEQTRQHVELTRKHLENIRVEKIELKDTDWRTVAIYLQDLANPKNGQKPQEYIHFINMLPTGFSFKTSINLHNVSLKEVVEEICQKAGLRYVVDAWAVIIDIPESKK